MTKKILFFDKPLLVLLFAILTALILTAISFIYAGTYESKNTQLKTDLLNIRSVAGDVITLKAIVQSKEKKTERKNTSGIVSTLEQILKTLGLEARAIKPLGKTKVNEFTEDNAELELQGTDLNSIVNLLYKIDISPVPLKIKNTSLKATFEDPDKFILKLTVSLMSKG